MTKRLKGVANLPLAPFVGVLFGMVAAILVFNTPAWMLEKLVSTIGLASILPAAAPPLGDTARSLLAVIVGVLVALPLWLVMRAIETEIHKSRVAKARGSRINASDEALGESRRRSPIRAGVELGAPLMSDEALSNGGELLLSESVARDVAPASPDQSVRQVQEETLLDLGSWKQEPDVASEAPFDLAQAEMIAVEAETQQAPADEAPATESRALPPVSWDEPSSYESWDKPAAVDSQHNALNDAPSAMDFITRPTAPEQPAAEVPPFALPWEATVPTIELEQEFAPRDSLDLSALDKPAAAEPEAANAEPASPVTFETVTFETVPFEAPSALGDPNAEIAAARPVDILDTAAFLTPDMLGDDFQDAPVEVERGLSAPSYDADPAAPTLQTPELPVSAPAFEPEAIESVSFETAPAWQNETPFDLTLPAHFAQAEAAPVSAAAPESAARVAAPASSHEDDASLLDLLDRLEAALAKRSLESAPSAPAPANLAALREILTQSQAANTSPRVAGSGW